MSQKNPQIFVTRLPRDITDEELRKTFRKFGKIKEVTLKRGYGFVEYESYKDARDAIDEMQDYRLGGQRIVVERAGERRTVKQRKGPQPEDKASECKERRRRRSRSASSDDSRAKKKSSKRHRRRSTSSSRSSSDSRNRSADVKRRRKTSESAPREPDVKDKEKEKENGTSNGNGKERRERSPRRSSKSSRSESSDRYFN